MDPRQGELDFVTHTPVTKRTGRPRKYRTNAERQAAYRQRLKRRQTRVYWRHESDLWSTDPEVFAQLNAEFHFTLEVCAMAENAKCARYFTPEQDGLQQDWGREICWNNPPYSQVARWIAKSYEASKAGATVVCLVYASVDTRWWHTYVKPYAEYRFPEGRLKFGGSPNSAPRASAIVIFRPPAEPT
jgi:phage N-6-adenine-methyltransferase